MNQKHIEILAKETGLLESTITEVNPKIYASNALAAMAELQKEIDELKTYTRHFNGCELNSFRGRYCTCGLNKLLTPKP